MLNYINVLCSLKYHCSVRKYVENNKIVFTIIIEITINYPNTFLLVIFDIPILELILDLSRFHFVIVV